MCSTDFDPASIFEVNAIRAKKRHRCDECGVDVLPGESYARADWLADGAWNHSVRCAGCYFLCQAIETLECGGHGQILWGGDCLREEVNELDESRFDDTIAPHWTRVALDALRDRIMEVA